MMAEQINHLKNILKYSSIKFILTLRGERGERAKMETSTLIQVL